MGSNSASPKGRSGRKSRVIINNKNEEGVVSKDRVKGSG